MKLQHLVMAFSMTCMKDLDVVGDAVPGTTSARRKHSDLLQAMKLH